LPVLAGIFVEQAQNTNGRRSAIDQRTTRYAGYGRSQRIRKRIEEAFGWINTVAGQRATGSGGPSLCGSVQLGAAAQAHSWSGVVRRPARPWPRPSMMIPGRIAQTRTPYVLRLHMDGLLFGLIGGAVRLSRAGRLLDYTNGLYF
jgi:hypothetical protein